MRRSRSRIAEPLDGTRRYADSDHDDDDDDDAILRKRTRINQRQRPADRPTDHGEPRRARIGKIIHPPS